MNKCIMVVDDDPGTLEILKFIIEDEGFDAMTVEESDDLLSLVKNLQPALILLDFGLKGIDGGTWCEKLKNTAEYAHIPVIIITAHSFKGLKKGSFGCNDFITKPFDIYDLVKRIKVLTDPNYTSQVNQF